MSWLSYPTLYLPVGGLKDKQADMPLWCVDKGGNWVLNKGPRYTNCLACIIGSLPRVCKEAQRIRDLCPQGPDPDWSCYWSLYDIKPDTVGVMTSPIEIDGRLACIWPVPRGIRICLWMVVAPSKHHEERYPDLSALLYHYIPKEIEYVYDQSLGIAVPQKVPEDLTAEERRF